MQFKEVDVSKVVHEIWQFGQLFQKLRRPEKGDVQFKLEMTQAM